MNNPLHKLKILQHLLQSRFRRFHSPEQLRQWQEKQIKSHLTWVCRHSPFYYDYQGGALADFPLMSKAKMMENFNQLNTCGLDREKLFAVACHAEQTRNFSQSQINGITVGLSSGTSGQRGLFLVSKAESLEWAGRMLGRMLPQLRGKHRIALLLRANSPLYQTINQGSVQFYYVDVTQPPSQWLSSLESFRPTLLVGSAQALQLCASQHLSLRPQLVISSAEVLTPSDKKMLAIHFSCPIHEVYQCTEGFLACTHADGILRWNEDMVHIEPHWLTPEKTHYSPIITDFRRRTQPIIRYLLDDVIEAGDDTGVFKPIRSITGRSGDQLRLPAKKTSERLCVLSDLIYRAITLSSSVALDYRISQLDDCQIRIESDRHHQKIEQALKQLFFRLGVADHIVFEQAPQPNWALENKQRRVVNLCAS